MKKFNTTGVCVPNKHYMVDISGKLNEIISLIEEEEYFTINRSRQYGKTTTLFGIENALKDKYEILLISFEGVSEGPFTSNINFVRMLIDRIARMMKFTHIREEDRAAWKKEEAFSNESAFIYLSDKITQLCGKYEVILMVDEMDKCSDNQVFLNFLGMLREKYLMRNIGKDNTFKSVILAGVYDVKNLKLKLRPDEERKYNSPWNIAVDFNIDMSFCPKEIATMLQDYEEDAHTGMNIEAISEELYHYTSGYPYLVSWICKWIDKQGEKKWCSEAIRNAVKSYYDTDSTLKDDLIKNYENNQELSALIDDMLVHGIEYPYVSTDEAVIIGKTFGFFDRTKNDSGKLAISNIIFENILMDHVLMKYARKKILKKQPEIM